MTDKSKEKVAQDKEAIKKMQGAQQAMKIALERIHELEMALIKARDNLITCKGYVGRNTYVWCGNDKIKTEDYIERLVSEANRVLG